MQSVKRAIFYPVLGWGIWMTVIMTVYAMLPENVRDSAFFVSLAATLSAIMIIVLSIIYMRKAEKVTSAREGLLVGLTAMGVVIVLDLIHNAMMSISLSEYFGRSIPLLLIIPITTTLILGCLRKK